MNKPKYQVKIATATATFFVGMLVLFAYVFPYLGDKHANQLAAMLDQKKTVVEMRQEQKNIELAKQDLQDLAKKEKAPEDFFSQDISLVNDLSQVESAARRFGLEFTFSVTGTAQTAAKAKTASDLYSIPFTMQLRGKFSGAVSFLDWLEHFPNTFTAKSASLAAASGDSINVTLIGNFYLRK